MRLPIACSLDASEMASRLADMRAVGEAALVSADAADSRVVLRFRSGADTLDRLRTIVAAEASCCPFLALELIEATEVVTLAIRAPEGGEPVLREIVAAFRGATTPF
jgi:hypothetical protein